MKHNQNFSVDVEPNKPLEAKCCSREEDAWPRWACQSAREEIEETATAATTETGATSERQRLSTGNIRLNKSFVDKKSTMYLDVPKYNA